MKSILYFILIPALLPVFIILRYVYRLDRNEREPLGFVLKVFVLGALFSLPCIGVESFMTSILSSIYDPETIEFAWMDNVFGIALVEELSKWLVLMFFVPEYRTWDMLRYMVTDNTRVVHIASGTYSISPIPGALWFLTAMFFTDVLYIALDRELGFGWKLHAAVVVISVLGMAFPTILPFRLPCAMDASFAGLCFFHLARSVRGTRWEKLLNLRLWQSLLGGAVFSVLIILSPSVNMRKGDYGWLLPFWINAMGAIVVLWSFSKNIESFLAVNLTLVNKWLKSIGRNSIVYLCLNQSIIVAALKLLDALGLTGTSAKLPALVLTMTLLLGFEKLLCNTGLRLIIGK